MNPPNSPTGFGLRQPSGAFQPGALPKSARGLAQSKTLARRLRPCPACFVVVLQVLLVLLPAIAARAQTNERYDSFRFGVCYYPEQWPQTCWEQDARRMAECDTSVTVPLGSGFVEVFTEESPGPSVSLAPFDYRVLERPSTPST